MEFIKTMVYYKPASVFLKEGYQARICGTESGHMKKHF